MMNRIFLVILSVGLLTGCSIKFSGGAVADGGVYLSMDRGDNWAQKAFVSKGEKSDVTIGNLNIDRLILWPPDNNIVYAIAGASGVWATYNKGAEWKRVFPSVARSLALHPTNRDIFLVASGNKIYRTLDGGETWQAVYIEGAPNTIISDLVIDVANSDIVYTVTSQGSVLRSRDGGVSWQAIYRFSAEVSRLYMSPSGVLYVGMAKAGLWRSGDRGLSWENLQLRLNELKLDNRTGNFRQFTFIPGTAEGFIYVNTYGLIKSIDGGLNWQPISLVTPPSSVGINTLAINSLNTNEIYYAISRLLYYSADGGITWITKPIPSTRAATALVINPTDPLETFLGLTKPSK